MLGALTYASTKGELSARPGLVRYFTPFYCIGVEGTLGCLVAEGKTYSSRGFRTDRPLTSGFPHFKGMRIVGIK